MIGRCGTLRSTSSARELRRVSTQKGASMDHKPGPNSARAPLIFTIQAGLWLSSPKSGLDELHRFLRCGAKRSPKKSCDCHSLGGLETGCEEAGRWKLQLDDSSFQSDHSGMRTIVGA